ncbi:MAG: peptidylprolyl isomerase [Dehalococcoidia bacterium]|nr:peptidylprolyl isomerase [Dehalococcoidia bacterium]
MPRKRLVVQRKRRQKSYGAGDSAAPLDLKPKGAFRFFHNYKLFAIIGAIIMVGSFGFGAFLNNNGSRDNSIRGTGVVRTTPEAGATSTTGASSNVKQYTAAPPMTIDPSKTYTAIIKTDKGDLTVQLLARDAPEAVNNFVFLAKDRYYDGNTFFRVIADAQGKVQFVQAGDPTGNGTGGPGYTLPFSAPSNLFDSTAGVLAMARPDSANQPNNGSQFFITTAKLPTFDGKWTAFGKVTQGLDILTKLQPRNPVTQQNPPPGARITGIQILTS